MNDGDSAINGRAEYRKLLPIIWTVLRLLGVYIVAAGISSTIEDTLDAVRRWRHGASSYGNLILLDYFTPRFFASVAYLAMGIYLLAGGRWIVHNIFLPADAAGASDREEEDG